LRQGLHHTILQREHLAVVGLVVVAAQVKHAVHDGFDQVLRVLGADDDIAQLAWSGDGVVLVDREGEDVGGLVLATVIAVELVDPLLVDQLDRQVPVGDSGGCECSAGRAFEARVVCLDLDQRDARRRSSEVWPPACWS